MDMIATSPLEASSGFPLPSGWFGHLMFAVVVGLGYAAYGLIKRNRSLSIFLKDFAWGAVSMLIFTFVLTYFFHVRLPWFDS